MDDGCNSSPVQSVVSSRSTVPLLEYLKENHPYWTFLSRWERIQLLAVVLPRIRVGVKSANRSLTCLSSSQIQDLYDARPSLATHATLIQVDQRSTTAFQHASQRLGHLPDTDLPLVETRGGSLHVLESLVVCLTVVTNWR